jgi:hypothetical protein
MPTTPVDRGGTGIAFTGVGLMRARFAIILLLWILPLPALAQTSTDDGVRAFVRGDYASAARILSPLAEATPDPDATAQFFMGMLYAAGKGVQMDSMRACTLFAAAAKPSNPFMEQASAVFAGLMQQMGPGSALCLRPPATGPRPMSFVLGPDYRVDVTPNELVVHYRGIDKTEPIGTIPGSLSLPVRYSPLDVTRPVATRRHFIQQFMWWQEPRDTSTWMLGWIVGEIVDGAYVPIVGERNVASTTAPRPSASLDVDSVARVRVNAQGEAEWQVLGGPNPRSEVIPWRTRK